MKKQKQDKPESSVVLGKPAVAYMANEYGRHFGINVLMTERTSVEEARFIVGELKDMYKHRMPAALAGGASGHIKNGAEHGGPHFLQASPRWLVKQIDEAWGL